VDHSGTTLNGMLWLQMALQVQDTLVLMGPKRSLDDVALPSALKLKHTGHVDGLCPFWNS